MNVVNLVNTNYCERMVRDLIILFYRIVSKQWKQLGLFRCTTEEYVIFFVLIDKTCDGSVSYRFGRSFQCSELIWPSSSDLVRDKQKH